MNCLYITLFFNIVAGIVQTFIKSWNKLLYPRVIEVCRLHFQPRHDFFLHLIIVAWIQEYVKNPMFHLQSHWSPETHLLPVLTAWETSARNPSVSFCELPLTFWAPSVQYSTSFWYFSLRILEKKLLHSPKHRWWISILLLLLVYVFSPSFRVFVRFGKALEAWCEADWVVGGCVRLCSRVAGIIVQGKMLNCHPTADVWVVRT